MCATLLRSTVRPGLAQTETSRTERPSLLSGSDAPLQFAQPLRADLTQRQREVVLRNHGCEADGRVQRERAVILDVDFQADTARAVRT